MLNCCYLPGEADETGYGSRVAAEIESCIANTADGDSWLREHPPVIEWLCDFPPGEMAKDAPFVGLVSAIAEQQGIASNHLIGFDT